MYYAAQRQQETELKPCASSGASDDASNVGVILEMARAIIANPEIKLAAPIIFLMNGGEEALCPAAHGFMQQSRWARDVGVFLNLESTGPHGPDFVFQHTGEVCFVPSPSLSCNSGVH